jgi:hypothetical protein
LDAGTDWGTAGNLTISVDDTGAPMVMTATQASGQYIQGAGAVHLSSLVQANNVDLTHISTTLGVDDGSLAGLLNVATGEITLSASQANGVQFLNPHTTAHLTIIGSSGDQSLFGSTGDDIIASGPGNDIVDINQGGSDTLILDHDGLMHITGFGLNDKLDFFDWSLLVGSHGTLGLDAYETVDYVTGLNAGGSDVSKFNVNDVLVGIGSVKGDSSTKEGMEGVFKGARDFLNSMLVDLHDMVFLVNDLNDTSIYIWKWHDTSGGDHRVQAGELKLLGTLDGTNSADLFTLTHSNFIV